MPTLQGHFTAKRQFNRCTLACCVQPLRHRPCVQLLPCRGPGAPIACQGRAAQVIKHLRHLLRRLPPRFKCATATDPEGVDGLRTAALACFTECVGIQEHLGFGLQAPELVGRGAPRHPGVDRTPDHPVQAGGAQLAEDLTAGQPTVRTPVVQFDPVVLEKRRQDVEQCTRLRLVQPQCPRIAHRDVAAADLPVAGADPGPGVFPCGFTQALQGVPSCPRCRSCFRRFPLGQAQGLGQGALMRQCGAVVIHGATGARVKQPAQKKQVGQCQLGKRLMAPLGGAMGVRHDEPQRSVGDIRF